MTRLPGLSVVAFALALSAASADAQAPLTLSDSARASLVSRADLGRIQGAEDATVWLVVISDFQCPFCKRWHDETEPRIVQNYVRTGKIRMAYLNLPISTHRNAWPAHEAAMCAAEQDRFWEAADAIFDAQDDWKSRGDAPAYFDSLMATLPLNQNQFRQCVANGRQRAMIQADYDRASRRGVGSTPTFLVGSRMLIGAQPYEAFAQAIDAAVAAADPAR